MMYFLHSPEPTPYAQQGDHSPLQVPHLRPSPQAFPPVRPASLEAIKLFTLVRQSKQVIVGLPVPDLLQLQNRVVADPGSADGWGGELRRTISS
jgi:hypothetical protein